MFKKRVLLITLVIFLIIPFWGASCTSELNRAARGLSVYRISASYDEFNHQISAKQSVEYVNRYDVPLEQLMFHLYPNAFRKGAQVKPIKENNLEKAYPNGESYGDILLTSVSLGGKPVEHSVEGQDRNILVIDLPVALYPGAKYTIDMEYIVRLPNVNFRFGYTERTVNLGNWFPVACIYENGHFVTDPYYAHGDPFYSEAANFYVDITLNSEFLVASTGRCIGTELKGLVKKLSFEALAVRDFAMVLSKQFKTINRTYGDVMITYYYCLDPAPDASADIALEALATFSELFGEYAYTTLSVVEVPFLFGGMEYPTLVYISDTISDPQSYRETIVHEIAHQWWCCAVGNNQVKYPWLDEGLTEYSTTMFYERNPKYGIEKADRIIQTLQSYHIFVELFQSVKGEVNTDMTRAVNEYESEYEYVYMTYVKGELMFDNVRSLVGDQKFFKALQIYYKENKYKIAAPEHLYAAFERATGGDIEPIFNSWLSGAVVLGD